MPAPEPLPPPGFASSKIDLHGIRPGETWRRLYPARHPNPLGFGRGASRFGDPRVGLTEAERYGVVYLGSTFRVCFLEAIWRDRGNARPGELPIELAELGGWTAAEIEVAAPLRLVDLRGDGPVRMRVPSDAVRASNQDLGRAWGLAFWAHDARPDGLVYPSRLNDEANIALFDRALGRVRPRSVLPLLDRREELAAIIRRFGLALV